jgi:hypothetical protein
MWVGQIIDVLVTITLIEVMVTVGLGATIVEVVNVAENWRLVGQAAAANYVLLTGREGNLVLKYFLVSRPERVHRLRRVAR